MDPSWGAAALLRRVLDRLHGDAVARRAFRRSARSALADHGLAAPAPSAPLVVNIMGRSAWLGDADLLGRGWDRPARPTTWAWMDGPGTDIGLLLVLLGGRPLALHHAPEDQAEEVARWARSRGLAAILGPEAFQPEPDHRRGGYADTTAARWPARAGSGGWRAVLCSPSPDLVVSGWLALHFGWEKWLGQLLGYPDCCTAAYPAMWRRATEEHQGDVARVHVEAEPTGDEGEGEASAGATPYRLAWTCNAFVRVLGAGLPLHFPCGPECAATDRVVAAQLDLLRAVVPERALHVEQMLRAPLVLGPHGQVACLVGARSGDDDRVTYEPNGVRCTSTTDPALALVLRRSDLTPADLEPYRARLVLPGPARRTEQPDALPVLTDPGGLRVVEPAGDRREDLPTARRADPA